MRKFIAVSLLSLPFVPAQADHTNPPILFKADQVTYSIPLDRVRAKGHVLVFHENRTLLANKIIFERKQGLIRSDGDVWLRTPEGSFVWAQKVMLQEDLLAGKIKQIRIIMSDNSRFAAIDGAYQENETILSQAVYSPCRSSCCSVEKTNSPLWQIKADEITHNREEHIIHYKNARVEIMGVPVFYAPYFQHPDPSIKRKSGMLTPSYGHTNDLGLVVGVPYYVVLSKESDITVTPLVTTKQGPVLIGEYRKRFRDSYLHFHTSYTRSHNSPVTTDNSHRQRYDRWHIMSLNRFEFNDFYLMNLDINRASDTTYLRRYPILAQRAYRLPREKNLTSSAKLERFHDHSYASANVYWFQTDNRLTTPFVAPLATYHYQSTPGRYKEIFEVKVNTLCLSRQQDEPGRFAKDFQRLTTEIGGQIPYISPWGDEWKGMLWLRGDINHFDLYREHIRTDNNKLSSTNSRLFPQGALHWRYPFVNRLSVANWLVEPAMMLVSSPTLSRNHKLPNEDSDNLELDSTNLFKLNRFPGLDRLDSGNRFVYGVNNTLLFSNSRHIGVFLGQTRRLDDQKVLPQGSGEDSRSSDVIMQVKAKPSHLVALHHQSRLQPQKAHPNVMETYLRVTPSLAALQIGHIYQTSQPRINVPHLSQMNWKISAKTFQDWSVSFAESRNLRKSPGSILVRMVTLTYKNDCLELSSGVYRNNCTDRDLRPDAGFFFQLSLKNLGTFKPSTAPGSSDDILGGFFI